MALLAPGSVAVVPSHRIQYSSQNIFYRFKQNNNVLYLTGFSEPDSVVMLDDDRLVLFRKPEDAHQLVWEGPKTSDAALMERFGFSQILPLDKLKSHCDGIGAKPIFTSESENDCVKLKSLVAKPVQDLTPHLHRVRAVKSDNEAELMRKSARIAASAFKEIMQRDFSEEKAIEDALGHLIKCKGASDFSYVPVVAGGPRACVIHYTRNNQRLQPNGMVLVDAGAMYNNYCSDITRCWPISKASCTVEQYNIYRAVYRIQTAVLEAMDQPQKYSLMDLHVLSCHFAVEELSKLGFKNASALVDRLYPHSIGHQLGMDLHDCPTIPFEETLSENMVVTVEPGLYIPDHPEFPERYRGIGVRIEDDVLVTRSGIEVLSSGAPKDPELLFA